MCAPMARAESDEDLGMPQRDAMENGSLSLFDRRRAMFKVLRFPRGGIRSTAVATVLLAGLALKPLPVAAAGSAAVDRAVKFVEMNNNVKKVVLTDDEAVYAIILNEHGIPLVDFFKDSDRSVTEQVRQLVAARKALPAIEAMKQAGGILEVRRFDRFRPA